MAVSWQHTCDLPVASPAFCYRSLATIDDVLEYCSHAEERRKAREGGSEVSVGDLVGGEWPASW